MRAEENAPRGFSTAPELTKKHIRVGSSRLSRGSSFCSGSAGLLTMPSTSSSGSPRSSRSRAVCSAEVWLSFFEEYSMMDRIYRQKTRQDGAAGSVDENVTLTFNPQMVQGIRPNSFNRCKHSQKESKISNKKHENVLHLPVIEDMLTHPPWRGRPRLGSLGEHVLME